MSTTVNALVEVCDTGADDEELAEAARRLRAELLELDVTGAEPAPAPAGAGPEGAKSGGVMAVAGLLVQYPRKASPPSPRSTPVPGWRTTRCTWPVLTATSTDWTRRLLANGRVYAGTRGGHVYAVRVMTGTLIRR
jgi:hypothetical protein